jgi:hypothetical protein
MAGTAEAQVSSITNTATKTVEIHVGKVKYIRIRTIIDYSVPQRIRTQTHPANYSAEEHHTYPQLHNHHNFQIAPFRIPLSKICIQLKTLLVICANPPNTTRKQT